MPKTSTARLNDLEIFPRDAVPKGRRAVMAQKLQERSVTIGRAVSSGALVALCVPFCLFYGGVSAYAWTHGMSPIAGVLFSLLSGGMLVVSGFLAAAFRKDLRNIVVVPEKLRFEAEMEATLDQVVVDINLAAFRWNDAAKLAFATRVDGPTLKSLLSQRSEIECRRIETVVHLKRFIAATRPTRADS